MKGTKGGCKNRQEQGVQVLGFVLRRIYCRNMCSIGKEGSRSFQCHIMEVVNGSGGEGEDRKREEYSNGARQSNQPINEFWLRQANFTNRRSHSLFKARLEVGNNLGPCRLTSLQLLVRIEVLAKKSLTPSTFLSTSVSLRFRYTRTTA